MAMTDGDAADVVVVGGGGAGMAAAIAAAEAAPDLDVLLCQKEAALGGVTGIAMGSFAAAETSYQAEAGIRDSADAHFEDLEKFVAAAAAGPSRHIAYGHRRDPRETDDRELRRLLVDTAGETLEWLTDLGCAYLGPFEEGHHRVPRMHVVDGDYPAILGSVLDERGVTVWTGSPVTGLRQDGNGRVTGVEVDRDGETRTVEARRGVVLATGSYVNNQALRAEFTADSRTPALYPANTGDGHELAREAGAALVNMDSQSVFIRCEGPLWTGPRLAALVDAGAILVNAEGQRFVDELVDYDQLVSAALDQPNERLYALFDAPVADGFREWPDYLSTYGGQPWGYVDDYLETDFLAAEDSLAGVAEHLAGSETALRGTVERYNGGVDYPGPGTRDPFGRDRHRRVLEEPPYYLLGPMRPYAATTGGGIAIDTDCRALTEAGDVIEGLYAAGSAAGGVHLYGHGHHHAWIFTSGRLAGRAAAQS